MAIQFKLHHSAGTIGRQSLVPDLWIAVQPLDVAEAEVARRRPACGLGGAVEGGVLHKVKMISCKKTR